MTGDASQNQEGQAGWKPAFFTRGKDANQHLSRADVLSMAEGLGLQLGDVREQLERMPDHEVREAVDKIRAKTYSGFPDRVQRVRTSEKIARLLETFLAWRRKRPQPED